MSHLVRSQCYRRTVKPHLKQNIEAFLETSKAFNKSFMQNALLVYTKSSLYFRLTFDLIYNIHIQKQLARRM